MTDYSLNIKLKSPTDHIVEVGRSDNLKYQLKTYEFVDGPVVYLDKDAYINVELITHYDKVTKQLDVIATCEELGIKYIRWSKGNDIESVTAMVRSDIEEIISKQFEKPVKVNFFKLKQ